LKSQTSCQFQEDSGQPEHRKLVKYGIDVSRRCIKRSSGLALHQVNKNSNIWGTLCMHPSDIFIPVKYVHASAEAILFYHQTLLRCMGFVIASRCNRLLHHRHDIGMEEYHKYKTIDWLYLRWS
jgi:hypothetical protein